VAPSTQDFLQGTLDLLILRTLRQGPLHGWGVSLRILEVSQQTLQIQQGSLYPALHRLEDQGLIQSEWGTSENNRRAKFYSLTRDGHRRLADDMASWQRFAAAVQLVLQLA
jgi:transcriptional regulator